MSSEEGIVIRLTGNRAYVHTQRSGMCEGCRSKSACNSLGAESDMEAETINTAGARIGDKVLINISSQSLWKIIFLLYFIPVIFLLAGSIVGYNIGSADFISPELFSLILGTGSCLFSYLLIKLIAKRINQQEKYMPEITKIL